MLGTEAAVHGTVQQLMDRHDCMSLQLSSIAPTCSETEHVGAVRLLCRQILNKLNDILYVMN